MGKLRELLEERTRSYAEYNNEILTLIEDNVVPAVLEMLDLTDNELDKLEWKHVSVSGDQLVLNGSIGYKEGDVISDGDTTVTLDSAMALLLDKIIRVSVPLGLAETGSKDDILEHLIESQRQLREDYERAYGHKPESIEEAMEAALGGFLPSNGMDFQQDFDYNELTEEQKEAMWIWGSMTDKNPWENEPN